MYVWVCVEGGDGRVGQRWVRNLWIKETRIHCIPRNFLTRVGLCYSYNILLKRVALIRWKLRLLHFGKWCPFIYLTDKIQHSSVGIATPHGLNGSLFEPRWGRGFLRPSRTALGPTHPNENGYLLYFPGVKRSGRGVNNPPPSRSKFKEEYSYACNPLVGLHGQF